VAGVRRSGIPDADRSQIENSEEKLEIGRVPTAFATNRRCCVEDACDLKALHPQRVCPKWKSGVGSWMFACLRPHRERRLHRVGHARVFRIEAAPETFWRRPGRVIPMPVARGRLAGSRHQGGRTRS